MMKNITIKKILNINNFYNSINNNNFISPRIKEYIFTNKIYSYLIEHNNTHLYLNIFDNDITKYYNTIKKSLNRIDFIRLYSNNYKHLDIWLCPTPFKKELPHNNIITCDNINSGSTTYRLNSNKNGKIHIWREEELLKVLVHELIHSFKIDRNHPEPKEAYTEYKALIFNIYFEIVERNLNISNNFKKLLDFEKKFSLYQSKKIYNYDTSNTNTFAYINEKGRLLHDLNKKEWISKINTYDDTDIDNIINYNSLRLTITDHILNLLYKD